MQRHSVEFAKAQGDVPPVSDAAQGFPGSSVLMTPEGCSTAVTLVPFLQVWFVRKLLFNFLEFRPLVLSGLNFCLPQLV